ncbi:hypothetical protein HDU97_008414 [Phlyctochytrium planicorne]|nr:hypothetical protein HDU97_008414 [Phlyctochytrium planicorne]
MSAPLPAVANWVGTSAGFSLIQAGNLCWDANTLAIGAQVYLQDCNPIKATQAFQKTTVASGTVLSAILSSKDTSKQLCVEYNTTEKTLSLQECRNTFANQVLNIQANPTLASDSKVCFGSTSGSNSLVAVGNCGSFNAKAVSTAQPQFPLAPYSIKTMQLGGNCLDGSNPSTVTLAACNGSPAQNWYTLWGQIRNVKNGLCLDAPGVTENDSNPMNLALTFCGGYPTIDSQLWIKSTDNVLTNGVSGNCIHADGNKVQLGTQYCTGSDKLRGDKNFKNIESFVTDLGNPSCTTPRSRKDFRDLSAQEQQQFFDGMNTLQKIPSLLGRRNRYHDYVALHGMGSGIFHGTQLFLPWHRYYSAILETDLQAVTGNPNFALPYWAWGTDSTTWALASTGILTKDRFGTTGQSSTNCVTDGFMKGTWVPNDQSCLARGYDAQNNDQGVATYTEDFILAAIKTNPRTRQPYTDYDGFRTIVEGLPHNQFHMMIAGRRRGQFNSEMGNPSVSVNDPVFWMHHNNIDRYWQYFQRANPKLAKAYDGQIEFPPYSGNRVTVNADKDILTGFNVPVRKGMAVREGPLCHRFEPYSKSIASVIVKQNDLARRAARFIKRDANVTGSDIIMNLEPAVAGKVVQLDAAVSAVSTDLSAKNNLPVPPRPVPAELSEEFLNGMKKFMKMDIAEIRKMEADARAFMDDIRKATDAVLKEQFGKTVGDATFVENAVAAKIAIASL